MEREVVRMHESEWEAYFKTIKFRDIQQSFLYYRAETDEVVFSYMGKKSDVTSVVLTASSVDGFANVPNINEVQ